MRIPPWLRRKLPEGVGFSATGKLLKDLGLNTVCQGASCPNQWECFSRNTAAFLIMGPECTRNCAYCNISPGKPVGPDPDEPRRLAQAAKAMKLKHVVVTSVTRDDLPDGGAECFAETIRCLREQLPDSTVEVLIPDFKGDLAALNIVLEARPEVLNHNVETVPDLYSRLRPQANYERSLELLRRAADSGVVRVKSGLMAGLGESDSQLISVIRDIAETGCHMLTIGQYMRPSAKHPEVVRYLTPQEFSELGACGRANGIPHVYSAPLVRSSYNADLFAPKMIKED